jgi:beta-mannosidase
VARGQLRWDLFDLGGRALLSGRKDVVLRRGASVRQRVLALQRWIGRHGRDRLYLRIALRIGRRTVSEETVFLSPPRFLDLPRGRTAVALRRTGPAQFRLSFTSAVFQHRFAFDLAGLAHASSDNYFDLYPGEPKTVTLDLDRPLARPQVRRRLRYRSLVDSYA